MRVSLVIALLLAATVCPSAGAVDFELPPLDRFEAMVARPLFVPSRRPSASNDATSAEPVSSDTAAEGASTDPRLVGLAVDRNGRVVAVLRGSDGDRRVAAGAELYGWTVVSVGRGRIVLKSGDVTETVAINGTIPPAAR